MPQFDRIHFLTQIFWISLSLIGIYFLIIRFYLSFYFVPGKIRKKLILLKEKSISIINLYLTLETSYSEESNYTEYYPYNEQDYDFTVKELDFIFDDFTEEELDFISNDFTEDHTCDYIYKYHCQHIDACKCNKKVSGDCDLI